MNTRIECFGILMLALIWNAGAKASPEQVLPDPVRPDAQKTADNSSAKEKNGEKINANNKIDPIKKAFALPRGVSLSSLNDKQKKSYEDLKKRYTPKLKEYLDKIATSTSENSKNIAAKAMMDCTKEIHRELAEILDMPARDAAQKSAQKATQKATQKAKQARKKAIQRAKKRH
jgi:predicted HicB family RNase H-like nuclease